MRLAMLKEKTEMTHGAKARAIKARRNIPILDDINDTGATFNWTQRRLDGKLLIRSPAWEDVWGENVGQCLLIT